MKMTEELFVAEAKKMYASLESELNSSTIDFYEYESRLDKLTTEFGRKVLELSLSETEVSSSEKKKFKLASVA